MCTGKKQIRAIPVNDSPITARIRESKTIKYVFQSNPASCNSMEIMRIQGKSRLLSLSHTPFRQVLRTRRSRGRVTCRPWTKKSKSWGPPKMSKRTHFHPPGRAVIHCPIIYCRIITAPPNTASFWVRMASMRTRTRHPTLVTRRRRTGQVGPRDGT
jgi:hypothetical protein